MSHMQFVKIDTSERINSLSTTPSQCTIHSNSYTFQGRYSLAYCYIPVTFYNVNASNNILYFTDTAQRTAVIAVGFYDSVSILVAVAAAMNAASASSLYAVASKNSATKAVTIASTNPFVLNLSNTANSIASILGFASLQDTASGMGFMSDSMANLAQIKTFNISINGLSSVVSMSGRISYSFVIPITTATPSILSYEPNTFIQTITFERPTKDITISVYDDNNNIIQLQEDFFIILKSIHH